MGDEWVVEWVGELLRITLYCIYLLAFLLLSVVADFATKINIGNVAQLKETRFWICLP